MDYKKLISEHMKSEKYLLLLMLIFLLTIVLGLVITHKCSLKNFIVLSFVGMFLSGCYFYRFAKLNNVYKKLTQSEQKELDFDINKTYFFSGRDYALTSKYIINFVNPSVIKYDSILIIDKTHELSPHHNKQNFMCDMVYIFTRDRKMRLIAKEYRTIISEEQFYEGLYSYIKTQNPNVLKGYTKENRKIIKDKYDIEI